MLWPIVAAALGFILVLLKARELKKKSSEKSIPPQGSEIPSSDIALPKTDKAPTAKNRPPKKGEPHPQHKLATAKKENSVGKERSKQKGPNQTVIELLQYGITIAAAFIGLSSILYLNTIKTENDKRNHLVTVLQRFHQDQIIYRNYLNGLVIDAKQMGDTLKAIKNSLAVHEYPYFANIKDPAAFEVSKFSIPLLSFADYQVRVSFDTCPIDLFQRLQTK